MWYGRRSCSRARTPVPTEVGTPCCASINRGRCCGPFALLSCVWLPLREPRVGGCVSPCVGGALRGWHRLCRLGHLYCPRTSANGPSWPPCGKTLASLRVAPMPLSLAVGRGVGPLWGAGDAGLGTRLAALSTASMKYARPCVDRGSPLASWGSRARRPSSLFGTAMWWCRMACVTPGWIVVSSRCSRLPFRMWGAGVPMSVSLTDLRGCIRSWWAPRYVVVSWRMATPVRWSLVALPSLGRCGGWP